MKSTKNTEELEPDISTNVDLACTPFEEISEHTVSELRKRLGISQQKFAITYGLNLATVKRWESGSTEPTAGPEYRRIISDWLKSQYVISPRSGQAVSRA